MAKVVQQPRAVAGRERVYQPSGEGAEGLVGRQGQPGEQAEEELQSFAKMSRCATEGLPAMKEFLFTSESVSEGHPDKVSDQISDAVLDAILAQDPKSRVAAETLCTTGLVVLAGEITTHANVEYIQVARETIKRIGYDNTDYGIDHKGCSVLVAYGKQSPDIAQGVDHAQDDPLNQGAGDQGLMFGYACDETPVLMPAPIYYSHRLVERQAMLRKDGRMPFLRPDAKSQVTFKYVDGKPSEIDTVVVSSQHSPEMSDGPKMKKEFIEGWCWVDRTTVSTLTGLPST